MLLLAETTGAGVVDQYPIAPAGPAGPAGSVQFLFRNFENEHAEPPLIVFLRACSFAAGLMVANLLKRLHGVLEQRTFPPRVVDYAFIEILEEGMKALGLAYDEALLRQAGVEEVSCVHILSDIQLG